MTNSSSSWCGVGHDVSECPKEIDAECSVSLPPLGGHKLGGAADELLGFGILEELDARVLALAGDAGPVSDGYPVVGL